MPSELPIACSLEVDELSRRLVQIGDLGHAALVAARTEPTRAQLWFAPGADVRARVDAIVAAESRCCAFLTMSVSEEPNAILLTIEAPQEAELVLAALVNAFRTGSRAEPGATGAAGPTRV